MPQVYAIGWKRTPLGSKGGGLRDVHPVELGRTAVRGVLDDLGLEDDRVDELVLGNATQTGQQGFNMANVVGEKAGLHCAASTINMLCGSGAKAICDAWGEIASGQAKIVIAGGAENNHVVFQGQDLMPPCSRPDDGLISLTERTYTNFWDSILKGPKMVQVSLTEEFLLHPMGKSGDAVAREWRFSREVLDRLGAESQWKAMTARHNGDFDNEIVPVHTPYGVVRFDDGIREDTTLEGLAKLPPRFGRTIPKWGIPFWPFTKFGFKLGFHTAGTSSQVSAGAAALALAGEDTVRELRKEGKLGESVFRLVASAKVKTDSQNPGQQLIGPPEAIEKVLRKANLGVQDMDVVEVNEAFAAVLAATIKMAKLDPAKVNVRGGAIALGNPLGASGARLPVTLMNILDDYASDGRQARYGLSTLCIGGGQAIAQIFERVLTDRV